MDWWCGHFALDTMDEEQIGPRDNVELGEINIVLKTILVTFSTHSVSR